MVILCVERRAAARPTLAPVDVDLGPRMVATDRAWSNVSSDSCRGLASAVTSVPRSRSSRYGPLRPVRQVVLLANSWAIPGRQLADRKGASGGGGGSPSDMC